jgi:hypothetical protein
VLRHSFSLWLGEQDEISQNFGLRFGFGAWNVFGGVGAI